MRIKCFGIVRAAFSPDLRPQWTIAQEGASSSLPIDKNHSKIRRILKSSHKSFRIFRIHGPPKHLTINPTNLPRHRFMVETVGEAASARLAEGAP